MWEMLRGSVRVCVCVTHNSVSVSSTFDVLCTTWVTVCGMQSGQIVPVIRQAAAVFADELASAAPRCWDAESHLWSGHGGDTGVEVAGLRAKLAAPSLSFFCVLRLSSKPCNCMFCIPTQEPS